MGASYLQFSQLTAATSALAVNFSLVLSGILFYLLILEPRVQNTAIHKYLSLGLGFGILAILSMMDPVIIREGIQVDAKYPLAFMATLFGGPGAGAICIVIAATFRIKLGGLGIYAALPSLAVIWISATLLWKWRSRLPLRGFSLHALIGIHLCITHVASGFVYFLFGPAPEILHLIIERSAPALLLYPPLSILLGQSLDFIAKRRQLQDEHAQLLLDLAQSHHELRGLHYSLLHDLRAPLVNIQGFLAESMASLREDNPQAAQAELEQVRKASDRLFQMLLGLTELDRVSRPIGYKGVQCLSEVVIRQAITERETLPDSVPCEYDISPGPWPQVNIAPQRLLQVVHCLLDNAIAHSHPKQPPRLKIHHHSSPTHATLTLTDNGRGLAPSLLKKVFEPFERGSAKSQGLGLGLTIARRIIEAYHGQIWLESPGEGQGLQAHIKLPLSVDSV